ncbi:MAG TPA: hypothetical protein VMD53_03060 [Rhizomicrobium sp.]|nr:hypothetical protein [Rhizomicrobium sp.]
MGTGEFYYLCMAIGAFVVFGFVLAWADWFDNNPPRRIGRQPGE